MHLHGHDFHVVGQGFGNFDADKDTIKYNLVDPVQLNTISMPVDGWVAIRFVADNPGTYVGIHLLIIWLISLHNVTQLGAGFRM
jgi:laccase